MQSTSEEPASELQILLDLLRDSKEKCDAYFSGDRHIPPPVLIEHVGEDIRLVVSSAGSLFDDNLHKIVDRALNSQSRLVDLLLDINEDPAASSSSHQPVAMIGDGQVPEAMILPPLGIPTFDGDASEYPHYRSILVSKVIENPNVPLFDKGSYFRSSLSGHPAELMMSHPMTEEELTSFLEVLDSFYGGTDKAIAALKRKLSELPAGHDTDSCRLTHALLEEILVSLTKFGHPIETDDNIRSKYRRKFPSDVIGAIREDDRMPLQEMRDAIRKAILEARIKEAKERRRVALLKQPTDSTA